MKQKNRVKKRSLIGFFLLGLILLFTLTIALFVNLSPQFGQAPSQEQKTYYATLANYKDGDFVNTEATAIEPNYWRLLKNWWNSSLNKRPSKDLLVEKIDSLSIEGNKDENTRIYWFGHSTFLLEIEGKKILLDPMFSEVPAPHPWLGEKRYSKELPIEIENLPFIDAVILSHDHYDHLDYESIQKLKGKVGHFFTPLGLGNHLLSWGIKKERITELNWWETVDFDNLKLVCTPSRHFSGRGFTRYNTLWSSWVIKGKEVNMFFSGDGGYGPHFKEIGDKYGPFDLSLMECGQYNEDWEFIHMKPEESAQAAVDLNSKLALPIHWAAFTLSLHDWTEPMERFLLKAEELKLPVTSPKIGERIIIGEKNYPREKWWKSYPFK